MLDNSNRIRKTLVMGPAHLTVRKLKYFCITHG